MHTVQHRRHDQATTNRVVHQHLQPAGDPLVCGVWLPGERHGLETYRALCELLCRWCHAITGRYPAWSSERYLVSLYFVVVVSMHGTDGCVCVCFIPEPLACISQETSLCLGQMCAIWKQTIGDWSLARFHSIHEFCSLFRSITSMRDTLYVMQFAMQ
jgi:hypothetical protein